jgi:hypothetical protein
MRSLTSYFQNQTGLLADTMPHKNDKTNNDRKQHWHCMACFICLKRSAIGTHVLICSVHTPTPSCFKWFVNLSCSESSASKYSFKNFYGDFPQLSYFKYKRLRLLSMAVSNDLLSAHSKVLKPMATATNCMLNLSFLPTQCNPAAMSLEARCNYSPSQSSLIPMVLYQILICQARHSSTEP